MSKSISSTIATITDLRFKQLAAQLESQTVALEHLPANEGRLSSLPLDLDPDISIALEKTGIYKLYEHQIATRQALLRGKDVIITTPTASGKTLCFNPTILETCLKDPDSTALYIFPLKALANDQMAKLSQMIKFLPRKLKATLLTGDVPIPERLSLFTPEIPQILAVSPDLLHHQLFKIKNNEWEAWRVFLRNLRYVVIDEAHTYVGAFGIHFSNLMRRLKLAIDIVGGNSEQLQFIISSATLGNPRDLATSFTHRNNPEGLEVIDQSGADTASRTLICLAPTDLPNGESARIITAWLDRKFKGIVFCNSRSAVKSLMLLLQDQLKKAGRQSELQKIAIFYGSVLGQARREIIEKLRSGQQTIIISTSALEAGIDLPELDCCLIRGYPGSLMNFRQRIGRVGRKNPGLIIYLPLSGNALDYYYGQHPEKLLHGEVESAAFNPDYPTILSKHLECACAESTIRVSELESRFGSRASAISNILLRTNKIFILGQGKLAARGYPHKDVNMRSNTQATIAITTNYNNEVIEEMSRESAYREVYPGAIYMAQDSQGQPAFYEGQILDLANNKAIIKPIEDPELSTQAKEEVFIEILQTTSEPAQLPTTIVGGQLELQLCWGTISLQVVGYGIYPRKYNLRCSNTSCGNHHQTTDKAVCTVCRSATIPWDRSKPIKENIFEQPYCIKHEAPILLMKVNAALSKEILAKAEQIKKQVNKNFPHKVPTELQAITRMSSPLLVALHSLEHLINVALPLEILCSSQDLNGLCVADNIDKQNAVAFFYDSTDGGNGCCEAIFDNYASIVNKAYDLAVSCDCSWGCPRCLFRHGCSHNNEFLNKQLGLFLLKSCGNFPPQNG